MWPRIDIRYVTLCSKVARDIDIRYVTLCSKVARGYRYVTVCSLGANSSTAPPEP